MYQLFLIATGGAIGALLRYLISGHANRILAEGFPWGTLAVNLIGCLLVGLLWSLTQRFPLPANANAFFFIGILGAFTTFSAYGLESVRLLQNGEIIFGLVNISVSNFVGLAAVIAGKLIVDSLFAVFRP